MTRNTVNLNSDRTSGEGRKSELFDSTSSGARFRISEGVGRPALGRPEGAGSPSYMALISDNSRAVEMWYEHNSGYVV